MTHPTQPSTPALNRGTLSRQLVLRVTGLVALVAILLSALTTFATSQILTQQLDNQLVTQAGRFRSDFDDDRGPSLGDGVGQQSGVIVFQSVVRSGTRYVRAFYNGPDGQQLLSAAVREQLAALDTDGARVVRLEGLGAYRLLIKTSSSGVNVIGLPMARITEPIAGQLAAAGVLTLGAIAISFLAAREVVARSLAPLNRLAATATSVSNLELERGEVAVPVRVSTSDADPVNEVGRVGLAFNHMLDNVEGALAARHESETKVRQFVADASHELRNPLASIRGYAELTRRERDSMTPNVAHALSRIESESDRMSTLVEDLLLLARLDSGPSLDLQPTDVTVLMLNAVSDARAAGPDHEWALSLPEEPVFARADRYRLHQVLANLLANARTHTPPGTRVEAALRVEGTDAVITVSDNGPGIPEEIRPRVFERFTRADVSRVRRQGGSSTGLGLAIVAAVVGAHGGRAEVASRPGHTVFTVRVPRAAAQG
ncbi:MAG: HAMP domain-containing histidine kinase [Micropruina sp.]|nr:HAMP domain-containing histidine kinase [Micropruina sp.]